jgi:uracil-DNA glycosylase family 4
MACDTPQERRACLVELYRELGPDHECPLAETRTNVVFGMGNADADLMFVGEAPGAEEDRQGRPFVGRAGKLLDQLLGEIGLERSQVFIANVLKCRPPGNRDPLPEEIEECSPHLLRQIELIQPKLLCTLGNFATKLLSGSPTGIMRCHGQPQRREIAGLSLTLYPMCHPAAALRGDNVLNLMREDFARIPGLLDEATAAAAPPEPQAAPELGPGLPRPEPTGTGGHGGNGAAANGDSPVSDEERLADQLDLFE